MPSSNKTSPEVQLAPLVSVTRGSFLHIPNVVSESESLHVHLALRSPSHQRRLWKVPGKNKERLASRVWLILALVHDWFAYRAYSSTKLPVMLLLRRGVKNFDYPKTSSSPLRLLKQTEPSHPAAFGANPPAYQVPNCWRTAFDAVQVLDPLQDTERHSI